MKHLILTAGYRASDILAMAELLRQAGHKVALILVVTPFGLKGLRELMLQRSPRFASAVAGRRLGRSSGGGGGAPLRRLIAARGIGDGSLRAWCREHGVAHQTVPDLNSDRAIDLVARAGADGVLHGGGGILERGFIDAAGGRVLGAQYGRMPEIRGTDACEWSLLLGVPAVVTVHLIDRGSDTGPVLDRISVEVRPGDDIQTLHSRCKVAAVEGLVRNAARIDQPPPQADDAGEPSLECFALAPALRELLEARLARRAAEGG